MASYVPSKDPDDVEPYHVVWCDQDGTNDGTANDCGELQGATISTSTWTVDTGITEDSSDTDAVSIKGVSYGVNTVSTIWLSGGTDETDYDCTVVITTSDSRTLSKTITVPVREH